MFTSPLSEDARETIQALWNVESNILTETAKKLVELDKQAEEIEKEARGRYLANAKRRDEIERKHLNGMTRLEWITKMGIDPLSGKTIDELRGIVKNNFPEIHAMIEKYKKSRQANMN